MDEPPSDDWLDEDLDVAEAAIRTIADWLMAEGIVGWLIDLPNPVQPVEVQLYSENRPHEPRILAHFGDAVSVTILPEDAPRIAPLTTVPSEPPRAHPRSAAR